MPLFFMKSFSQNNFGIAVGGGISKEGNSLITTLFKSAWEIDLFYKIDFNNYLDIRIITGYKNRGYKDNVNLNSPDGMNPVKIHYHLISLGPDCIFRFPGFIPQFI